jgi:hypothetical protein
MSTHPALAKKRDFDRRDMRAVFSNAYRAATQRRLDEIDYERGGYALRNTAPGSTLGRQTRGHRGQHHDSINQRTIGHGDHDDDDLQREVPNPFRETVTGGNYQNNRPGGLRNATLGADSATGNLDEILSKGVLRAVQACEKELGGGGPGDLLCLTMPQLVKAFEQLRIPPHETRAFFDEHEIGQRFYYREVLLQKFGQQAGAKNIPGLRSQDAQKAAAIAQIKEKLRAYMVRKQWSLDNLIAIFTGTRKGGDIMVNDFAEALKPILDLGEATTLFAAIDVDNSRDISREEILSELAILNAALSFETLRSTAENAAMKVDEVFNSVDADRNDKIEVDEFAKLVELMISSNKDESEIEMLFNAVDRSGKGYISR